MSTTNHVLPLPQAFLALRVAQLAVGVVILGLSAYIVSYIAFNSACLTLFTALATMIIAVYNIVSSTGLKVAYNYWAILGLDIFAIVFWIISFSYEAWTTAAATDWYESVYTCTWYDGYCYKKRDLPLVSRATTNVYTYRNSMAAAAGLGGLEFILFAITLIFTALHVVRHRKAGGHSAATRTSTGPAPVPADGPAPVYSETKNTELNGQNGQQQYVQQPQPQQPVQYVEHSGQPQPQIQTQPQQEYYAPQPNQQVQSA